MEVNFGKFIPAFPCSLNWKSKLSRFTINLHKLTCIALSIQLGHREKSWRNCPISEFRVFSWLKSQQVSVNFPFGSPFKPMKKIRHLRKIINPHMPDRFTPSRARCSRSVLMDGGQWGPILKKNSTPSPWKRRKTTSSATFYATGAWGLSNFFLNFHRISWTIRTSSVSDVFRTYCFQ